LLDAVAICPEVNLTGSVIDLLKQCVDWFLHLSMVIKFTFWSFVLLILVLITLQGSQWNNQNASTPEYTHWQQQYKDIAYALATTPEIKEATEDTPIEVIQATLMQFPIIEQDGTTQQRVDRCQSCHVGLLNPQMTAENIIKIADHKTVSTEDVAAYLDSHPATLRIVKTLGTHPGVDIEGQGLQRDLGVIHDPNFTYGVTVDHCLDAADAQDYAVQKFSMSKHPFPTFGCTTCHYGSGRELVQTNAHGMPEHWMQPLLAVKYMDAACAQCHVQYHPQGFKVTYLTSLTTSVSGKPTIIPLMTTIARGEQLFKDKACYGCHKIDGFSKGNVGPELTYEGRLAVPSTIEHQIWDPRYKVSSCVMPYFFSYRLYNTDDMGSADAAHVVDTLYSNPGSVPNLASHIVDWRAAKVVRAQITNPDTVDSLKAHGYIPDASAQADVDALVTFVSAQTGQNYAGGQADRMTTIAAYNGASPPTVPTTVAEGKVLFDKSGCTACHWVGDPKYKGDFTKDPHGKGGIAGPPLTWEGSRHSQEWLIAHYENPQAFVPGSIMPIFPFSDSQRKALALFDQSMMPDNPGARIVTADQDMPTAALVTAGVQTSDIRYMVR
jgi:mono/diheme cytochrome c family protein